MSIDITIPGGETRRLLTGGKYCPEDIEVTAEGTQLPALTNPAVEEEIFEGKETIDETGAVKTGTFTLASELTTQDSLIAQIKTALQGKAAGGSAGVSTCSVRCDLPYSEIYAIFYSAMENGQITTKIKTYHDNIAKEDDDEMIIGYYVELADVVVGSTIHCWMEQDPSIFSFETSGAVQGEIHEQLTDDGYPFLSFQILSDATINVTYAE